MRIIKLNCSADSAFDIQIDFSENEIATIDNALYYAKELEKYKEDKNFLDIRTKFHILREIVNHGIVNCDEIKFAYDEYEKLGKYECWKELERKKTEKENN